MNVPTINKLAFTYGVTRQRLWKMRKSLGISTETLADPDKLLTVLLERNAGKLRDRLSDSATREKIRIQLHQP